jgi:fructokinase
MGKLISIGEALIDFVPLQKGVPLSEVLQFKRVAGGAPANVCACVSKLGVESILLTQLGMDGFGDHIINELQKVNVNVNHVKRTNKANTGLAFVSLKEDGDREFSFYRDPSADLLMSKEDIDKTIFSYGDILHFCSVDLVDSPMKETHNYVLKIARENGCLISFDPNVRLPLWEDHNKYKSVINEYIGLADILKISDEELEFITGTSNIEEALSDLFRENVKVIIYTKGPEGAVVYTKTNQYSHNGFKVIAVDTTGAGDSFIGAFIFKILDLKIDVNELTNYSYTQIVAFANGVGAIVASKMGAIPSMPTKLEVKAFIEK